MNWLQSKKLKVLRAERQLESARKHLELAEKKLELAKRELADLEQRYEQTGSWLPASWHLKIGHGSGKNQSP
jgi:hypothetical protein